ncbi:MAG TPA: hypothetical protein VGN16_18870 [Acidobacteriaceae bacterium]|jgi:hypothetical protein
MPHYLRKILFIVALITLSPAIAQSNKRHNLTSLSDNEAQALLQAIPSSISAKRQGVAVDIEKSGPTQGFPNEDFFVAAVVRERPAQESPLGNGILGYFAVDRHTGEVISLNDFTKVKSKHLDEVRFRMCRGKCAAR